MPRKTENISILHLSSSLIARLRVRSSENGVDILSFDQQRGDWPDGPALEQALTAFAQTHTIAADTLYTILPRHDITTRILTMPSQDPAELRSMVLLSAEEFVPYATEELIVDQGILQKLPSGEARVLAVLAHQDVVNSHLKLLHAAGLDPRSILLSTACLAAAVQATPGPGTERYAIVNLLPGGLEILVIDENAIQYGRGVATTQNWDNAATPGSPALDELTVEVRGSLATYRRESEDGLGVEQIFLCSETIDVAPLAQLLAAEIGKDCAPADFALAAVTNGREKISSLPLMSIGGAIAAQGRAALNIDLLPAHITHGRAQQNSRRNILTAAACTLLVMISLGLWYGQAVWQHKRYIAALEQQVADIEPGARGVQTKQAQLHILRRQVDPNGTVLELLAKTTEAAPKDLNITSFNYEREKGIDLYGRALTVDDVHNFTTELRKQAQGALAYFAHAHSVYEQKDAERGQPVFLYHILIPVNEETDEKAASTPQ